MLHQLQLALLQSFMECALFRKDYDTYPNSTLLWNQVHSLWNVPCLERITTIVVFTALSSSNLAVFMECALFRKDYDLSVDPTT